MKVSFGRDSYCIFCFLQAMLWYLIDSASVVDHAHIGTQIKPRDELLNLLACGSASPGLHQFLASLGEVVMHLITW
jgi:hypothetical protein